MWELIYDFWRMFSVTIIVLGIAIPIALYLAKLDKEWNDWKKNERAKLYEILESTFKNDE